MKIQLIGGSGTGKSTLAKYISEQEHIKWIDTDMYLWTDETFTENHPVEIRKEMYQRDMEQGEGYVVSGSVFSWNPDGFDNRELLVFLELDESERLDRLRKREKQRMKEKESWLDENGELTNDFIEWCKTYCTANDWNSAGTYAEHLHQMEISKSPVLKLNSHRPVEELYEEIVNYVKRKAF